MRAADGPRAAPFGFTRIVFLSHVITAAATFPGDPPVEIHPAATIERDGYHLQSLVAGEQAGTHWAAPAHFAAGRPPQTNSIPAILLPRGRARRAGGGEEDPDFALGVAEITSWEAEFGPVPAHGAVIMWTGFEDRWDDPPAYLNADAAGGLHYPGFGADAVSWLIEQRSIGALGIDTMGIDPGADTSFGANRLLLREHRIHLENLAGQGEMPPSGGWIIVGGIRIRGGSGSPATVFGLIP